MLCSSFNSTNSNQLTYVTVRNTRGRSQIGEVGISKFYQKKWAALKRICFSKLEIMKAKIKLEMQVQKSLSINRPPKSKSFNSVLYLLFRGQRNQFEWVKELCINVGSLHTKLKMSVLGYRLKYLGSNKLGQKGIQYLTKSYLTHLETLDLGKFTL